MNRITKWLDSPEEVATLTIHMDNERLKYQIKEKKGRWAIFVPRENKLRRKNDLHFIDVLMILKKEKQEGVSILKTLSRRF